MSGIRTSFRLFALLSVLALSLGPATAPVFAGGTSLDNGQDPPLAPAGQVEQVLDGVTTVLTVLVSVIL